MISELKIRNFKSLESVDLKLGHFNLLVGANASGKSNFLDALRFLQGVGNGLTNAEILDGKPQSGTNVRWPQIRGGSKYAAFRRKDGWTAETVEISGYIPETSLYGIRRSDLSFELKFKPGTDKFQQWLGTTHCFWHNDEKLYSSYEHVMLHGLAATFDSTAAQYSSLLKQRYPTLVAGEIESRDNLSPEVFNLSPEAIHAAHILDALRDMQFLNPLQSFLTDYSSAKVVRLGESGEGLAGLVHEIMSNGSKPALLDWLKELRPEEVSDLYALPGAVNDYMVAIKEGDTEFPAPALSEGTLRFIALAAAFFQPSMPKILVIEEIEKGLHPSRLRLLLELMRSQSKRTGTQVFATTHSPTLLNWLTEEDRKTTFVCTRDAESGATKMRSLSEVPNLEELIKKNYNLDQLFEEGWLESVLHES
jgi:recombinational DNA repair ATPase RecF